MTENPTLDEMSALADELRGDEEKSPVLLVTKEISRGVTLGMIDAQAMRIDLYLGDLVSVVYGAILEVSKGETGKSDEELLEKIRETDGYKTATTNYIISDETSISIINEAKVRLAKHIFPGEEKV